MVALSKMAPGPSVLAPTGQNLPLMTSAVPGLGNREHFFRNSIFSLARSLARIPQPNWESVRGPLMGACPPQSACAAQSAGRARVKLGEKECLAVMALGVYFLETRCARFGEKIVPYLLQLFGNLVKADILDKKASCDRKKKGYNYNNEKNKTSDHVNSRYS